MSTQREEETVLTTDVAVGGWCRGNDDEGRGKAMPPLPRPIRVLEELKEKMVESGESKYATSSAS